MISCRDCRSRDYKLVALTDKNRQTKDEDIPVVLVTNSNVKHTLSGSEYPERVAQCKLAVAAIQKKYPTVKALRDVTPAMLSEVASLLDPVVIRRAGHSISEDQRTLTAIEAISVGDYPLLGKKMTESHISLRDNYEVSCEELDVLVNLALEYPGVFGSRMTGGGFGGCTVTLVKKGAVKGLEAYLKKKYYEKTGLSCECYVAVPSEGAGSFDIRDLCTEKSNTSKILSWLVPLAVGVLVAGTVGYALSCKYSKKSPM